MGNPRKHNPDVTGKQALRNSALALRAWMMEEALPFWAKNARDERGGFCEELSRKKRAKLERRAPPARSSPADLHLFTRP